MTETMLEKMARAMYEAAPGTGPVTGPQWAWDWMVSEGWELPNAFRRRARAALQAIRRPDANACEAAERATGISKALANHVFTAMIDAILSEAGE